MTGQLSAGAYSFLLRNSRTAILANAMGHMRRNDSEDFCRRAVRTGHASAALSRVVRAMGPAGRAARVGKATRAAGGMQVNRDGRERDRRPCLRAPPHSPADAGLFVGRRSATAAVHAPGLRWHTGEIGRAHV